MKPWFRLPEWIRTSKAQLVFMNLFDESSVKIFTAGARSTRWALVRV